MKVLVIDDSEIMRKMIKSHLDIMHANIFDAPSAEIGLEILEKHEGKFNVILLDWNMPNMSGLDFLREMKKVKGASNIPVVMVTSKASPQDVQEAVQEGISGYIVKPVSPEVLLEKIKTFES